MVDSVDIDVEMELGGPEEDYILPDIGGDVPEVPQDTILDPEDPFLEPGERKRKADPRTFKCPHCEREYRRKRELESHLMFHAGEEPTHECIGFRGGTQMHRLLEGLHEQRVFKAASEDSYRREAVHVLGKRFQNYEKVSEFRKKG
jgi:hypothetical protein